MLLSRCTLESGWFLFLFAFQDEDWPTQHKPFCIMFLTGKSLAGATFTPSRCQKASSKTQRKRHSQPCDLRNNYKILVSITASPGFF